MSHRGVAGFEIEGADPFHALLPAMARALDVREVFRHISRIAGRIIPHDEADLALITEDLASFRLVASTSDDVADAIQVGEHCEPCDDVDPSQPRVFYCEGASERGFQTGLSVPVAANDQLIGVLAFLSRDRHAYSDRDLEVAQRVADYLAVGLSHHRLADAARRTSLESSEELLRTIAEVLDIRQVFPRVSEIASAVLPHDHLHLIFQRTSREVTLEASSSRDFPVWNGLTIEADLAATESRIVGDLRRVALPVTDPPDFRDRIVAAGYRSLLGVGRMVRDQRMGLGFWSKRVDAYSQADVQVARRIADYIALAVSHEQLAHAQREAAEARARAERLEVRVKSLAAELDLKTGAGRAVGQSPQWQDVLKKAAQVAAHALPR